MKKTLTILFLSLAVLLSGCGASGDANESGTIPYEDQIDLMQGAVNAFQEESGGLLPIKTREFETDIYIKYPIDFSKIVPIHTEAIPGNAYEKGGIFQYVLVDVETNPTVKLVDLRIAERIRELNVRKNANSGSIPFNEEIGDGVYKIDYEKLGYKQPVTVKSPYSETHLPLVVGGNGKFYIDYSIELNRILVEEKPQVEQGEDIRYLLSEKHPVLPAYSLPYTVNEKNEPIFMNK